MKHIVILTISAMILSFAGCKKVEDVNNEMPLETGVNPGPLYEASTFIRSFATFELLSAEIEQTTGFSLEDLIAYEKNIGFNSYGKVADQRMMEILRVVDYYEAMEDTILAATRAAAEIEQMLSQNATYIHMVTDDEGEISCETKYYRSPFRYVMNIDRMFRVDTLYFKVFEGGHASCGVSNLNALRNLSEAQFDLLEEDDPIFNVCKYDDGTKGGNHGPHKKITKTSGSNRVHVELTYVLYSRQWLTPGYKVDASFRVKTWSEKKVLFKWWSVQHTYTNNINARIMIGGNLKGGSDVGSNGGYKREKELCPIKGNFLSGIGSIYDASGYGKTPGITCNVNLN